jgi:hypothetical protein
VEEGFGYSRDKGEPEDMKRRRAEGTIVKVGTHKYKNKTN